MVDRREERVTKGNRSRRPRLANGRRCAATRFVILVGKYSSRSDYRLHGGTSAVFFSSWNEFFFFPSLSLSLFSSMKISSRMSPRWRFLIHPGERKRRTSERNGGRWWCSRGGKEIRLKAEDTVRHSIIKRENEYRSCALST